MYRLIFRSFVVLVLLALVVDAQPTVKQLSFVHRHGAREAPLIINGKRVWKFAQLTPNGETMMRNLGLLLRKEYGGFISSFDPSTYDVRSGDSDRCIQSAQGVLRAFFNQSSRFVPIVKYDPPDTDWLIEIGSSFPNTVARPQWRYAYQANDTLARQKLSPDDIEILAREFGSWCTKTPMLCSLFAADSLQCRISNTNGTSDVLLRLFQEKLLPLDYENNKYAYGFHSTDPYAVSGSSGYTLAAKMLSDSKTGDKKVYHYSAHDTTVVAVLNAFGSIQLDDTNPKWTPRFGALLALTTYTDGNISFCYAEPEQEARSSLSYTSGLVPITVRCQTAAGVEYVASACPVDDVWRYLNRSKPTVANPFCYLRPEDKCDLLDAVPSAECQYYRRHCPGEACGHNAALDRSRNYTCASLSRSVFKKFALPAGLSGVVGLVLGVLVGVLIARFLRGTQQKEEQRRIFVQLEDVEMSA